MTTTTINLPMFGNESKKMLSFEVEFDRQDINDFMIVALSYDGKDITEFWESICHMKNGSVEDYYYDKIVEHLGSYEADRAEYLANDIND